MVPLSMQVVQQTDRPATYQQRKTVDLAALQPHLVYTYIFSDHTLNLFAPPFTPMLTASPLIIFTHTHSAHYDTASKSPLLSFHISLIFSFGANLFPCAVSAYRNILYRSISHSSLLLPPLVTVWEGISHTYLLYS